MIKQKFDIDDLRVASPCSVGWENMSGDERTRFCGLCSLNVYNISELTTKEVRSLIEKSEGRICGRIYKRADGTVLTKDCPVGLRAYYKRTARFAGAALAVIAGLFSVGFGQKDSKKAKVCKVFSSAKIARAEIKTSMNFVEGTITDKVGAIVAGVKITLTNEETKEKLETATNDEGYYVFQPVAPGIYIFKTEKVGFKNAEMTNLEIKTNEKLQISIELEPSSVTVTVGIFFEEPMIDMRSTSVTHTIRPNQFPPF